MTHLLIAEKKGARSALRGGEPTARPPGNGIELRTGGCVITKDAICLAVAVAAVLAMPVPPQCGAAKGDAAGPEVTRSTSLRPTREDPLVVDREGRKVLLYAEVNRKYVTQPTRHGIVSVEGSNSEGSVFKAFANVMDVHKALVDIGTNAGENVKLDSPAGTLVGGDELDVRVEWGGQSRSLSELISSSGEFGGRPLVIRFGGNAEVQRKKNSGCILCLDSCAAGITSNAAVGWKSFADGKVEFRARGDLLPEDGQAVTIVFSAK